MSTHISNAEARSFKDLHVPGQPLLLANVHDAASARLIASLPGCKALATTSYSLALANGTDDDNLDLDAQLEALRAIANVARQTGKPLTVDLQSGYGERLEEAVTKLVGLGVVGVNLEDSNGHEILDDVVASERVRRALKAAAAAGLSDFVVNARADSLLRGGTLEESIRRGRLYIEAGATTVYILPPNGRALRREEIEKAVAELQGMVNVGLRLRPGAGALGSEDLARLGVARVSIGPQLYLTALAAMKAAAETVFGAAGGGHSSV